MTKSDLLIGNQDIAVVSQRLLVVALDQVEQVGAYSCSDKSEGAGHPGEIADDVPRDATPFDMTGCDLSHHGDDVTFETILRRHDLVDPVLWRLAEIVHQADLEDDLYDAPEAAGLDVIVRALERQHGDEQVRHLAATILDSLEDYFRQETFGRA